MMQVSVEVVLASSRQEQFLSVLIPQLEPTRCVTGCISCSVWKSMGEERQSIFMSEWESAADLDRYLESDRFRKVLVATEMSEEAPVIKIQSISETRGLSYVMELLHSKDDASRMGSYYGW